MEADCEKYLLPSLRSSVRRLSVSARGRTSTSASHDQNTEGEEKEEDEEEETEEEEEEGVRMQLKDVLKHVSSLNLQFFFLCSAPD